MAAALVAVILAVGCSPEESTVLGRVNDFRRANGVPELAWEEGAYAKAKNWSDWMAWINQLTHSPLTENVPPGWRVLGENVAWSTSLEGAVRGLEESPRHRANLLNPAFDRVAIGVTYGNGRYWVTQVFLG